MDWLVGGAVAGQVKAGGGLTFLAVEGAGHMVPMDQPANVRAPIITIINAMRYYNDTRTHTYTHTRTHTHTRSMSRSHIICTRAVLVTVIGHTGSLDSQ